MSIEYGISFSYILKGLGYLNLVVTLGGNSNHFKVNNLREIGLWDVYNMTEDAELGIRIYQNGYKTYLSDSITLEECVINLITWINQRSRRTKGFIQVLFITLMIEDES